MGGKHSRPPKRGKHSDTIDQIQLYCASQPRLFSNSVHYLLNRNLLGVKVDAPSSFRLQFDGGFELKMSWIQSALGQRLCRARENRCSLRRHDPLAALPGHGRDQVRGIER
jgi:hypothetical protein